MKLERALGIAFTGRSGAGKTTASNALRDELLRRGKTVMQLSFAGPLKGFVDALADPVWADDNYARRRALQRIGQAMREYDEGAFVRHLLRLVESCDAEDVVMLVDDVRYLNEAAALAQAGFRIVRIERPNNECELPPELAEHESEQAWGELPFHCAVFNVDSLAQFKRDVCHVVEGVA